MNVPTGWAGSDNRCIAGTQAAGSRTSTLRALNFTRSLAGLAPVTFSTDLNSRSQQTALIMSASKALSHTPPSSWRCYTAAGGANAARSNLSLAYPSNTSSGIVAQYLEDYGSSNRPAGHRRWLLNPFSTTMGSGSTNTANAITVIGPTATSRPNPVVDGYAQPTSVWQIPASLARSGTFKVEVSSIRATSKSTRYTRTYTVRMFTPGA